MSLQAEATMVTAADLPGRLRAALVLQRAACARDPVPGYRERRADLAALRRFVLWHVAQHDLPFGGVGASGMGHYHGIDGFVTFSKLRPVFYQAPVSGVRLLWPPFGALTDRVLRFLVR